MRTFEFKLQYDEEKLMDNLNFTLKFWKETWGEALMGLLVMIWIIALAFALHVAFGIMSIIGCLAVIGWLVKKQILSIINGVEVKDEYKFS